MSNIFLKLEEKKLISPPKWLGNNIIYLTIVGSVAYATEDTTKESDIDICGVCIPPKNDVFPWLAGAIPQFDEINSFQQYIAHHICDENSKDKEYDITVHGIVKYFKLLMENNPSFIETLFTSHECILQITKIGNLLRENRKIFLNKGCWQKFKGYSYSMLHKMNSKTPKEGSKRFELREKFGYDVKFGMHTVRLLLQAEQLLSEGDLDLRRNKEQLKSIRRGEWTTQKIKEWAQNKEKQLEELYLKSSLPCVPDKAKIKSLLLNCLEEHYGNLEACIVNPNQAVIALNQIQEILNKNKLR